MQAAAGLLGLPDLAVEEAESRLDLGGGLDIGQRMSLRVAERPQAQRRLVGSGELRLQHGHGLSDRRAGGGHAVKDPHFVHPLFLLQQQIKGGGDHLWFGAQGSQEQGRGGEHQAFALAAGGWGVPRRNCTITCSRGIGE